VGKALVLVDFLKRVDGIWLQVGSDIYQKGNKANASIVVISKTGKRVIVLCEHISLLE